MRIDNGPTQPKKLKPISGDIKSPAQFAPAKRLKRIASEVKDTKGNADFNPAEEAKSRKWAEQEQSPAPGLWRAASAVNKELSGKGWIAKHMAHATGKGGSIDKTASGLATVMSPGLSTITGSKAPKRLIKNGIKDFANAATQIIPSVYEPVAAAVEASTGHHQRQNELGKQILNTDPIALAAQGRGKDLKKQLSDHPGYALLEAAGAKGVLGRGAGRVMRAAPSERLNTLASRTRTTRTLPGTKAAQIQTYSPDVIRKAQQVGVEKVRRRLSKDIRPDKPGTDFRTKTANFLDPDRLQPRELGRQVDEVIGTNRSVHAMNRAEAIDRVNDEHNPRRTVHSMRKGRTLRKPAGTGKSKEEVSKLVDEEVANQTLQDQRDGFKVLTDQFGYRPNKHDKGIVPEGPPAPTTTTKIVDKGSEPHRLLEENKDVYASQGITFDVRGNKVHVTRSVKPARNTARPRKTEPGEVEYHRSSADAKQRAAIQTDKDPARKWDSIQGNPFSGKRGDELRSTITSSEGGELAGRTKASEILQRDDPGGQDHVVVPDVVKKRIRAHAKADDPETTSRLMKGIANVFRKSALTTSLSWPISNAGDGGLRAGLEGAGAVSRHRGNKAIETLRSTDPQSARRVEAQLFAGGHYGSAKNVEERGAPPLKILKRTRKAVDAYTRRVYGGNERAIENPIRQALHGKLMREHNYSAADLKRPEVRSHLNRELDRTYGKYDNFRPEFKKIKRDYVPFMAYPINAARLVRRMPKDHPLATAAIASAETITDKKRKARGQDLFVKNALPAAMTGAIVDKQGKANTMLTKMTSLGILAGNPAATMSSLFTPFATGALNAAKGQDWKGMPVRNKEGKPLSTAEKWARLPGETIKGISPTIGRAEQVIKDKSLKSQNPFKTFKVKPRHITSAPAGKLKLPSATGYKSTTRKKIKLIAP